MIVNKLFSIRIKREKYSDTKTYREENVENLGLTSYNDFLRKAMHNVYAPNDIDSGPLLFSSLNNCFRRSFYLKGK